MPKAMIISVGTGRDRQDIAKAISFSIKQNNPEYIRFLVSEEGCWTSQHDKEVALCDIN